MYTISKAPHLILRAPRGHLFCRTTTFSWCNDTIAGEKCCLYPPADLPRGKTFFPSERRESNSFHCRNHATHLFVTESHEMNFQLFSRRIHFNNLNIIQIPVCFAFSFHFLHLFFFAKLPHFFHKTPWRTWHSLPSIVHVYLCPNRPLPFHLHLHEISKFLDSET